MNTTPASALEDRLEQLLDVDDTIAGHRRLRVRLDWVSEHDLGPADDSTC